MYRPVGHGRGGALADDEDDRAKWRRQFVERRLEGLYDEPRVGAPRTISDAQVEAIIVKTLETTPAGETVDDATYPGNHGSRGLGSATS